MLKDNETVYDTQIAPLMAQIIDICKRNELPMVAAFEYKPRNFCTTAIPIEGQSAELRAAANLIRSGVAAFAVRLADRLDSGEKSRE